MKKRLISLILIYASPILAQSAPKPVVWVNVFIHGIVRPVANIGDMIKITQQRIEDSRYKHITRYVRRNSVVHRCQASQGVGLEPIKMAPNPDNNGSRAMVAVFKKFKQHAQADRDTQDLYYTFGWSGVLSYESRQKAAAFLYKKLIRLVDRLKASGVDPKLRILGFSHGGNVALQLANCDLWNPASSKLSIAQLITLGMPIQKDNDVLILHPMFKKVYHFYSIGDIPQTLDFITTDFGTSRRRYQSRKCFTVPDKLTQIEVVFTKDIPSKRPFTPNKPYRTTSYHPTHIEMWSFGWTPTGYNKNSPLFPLPTAAIAPYLIDVIEHTKDLGTNLIANIYPHQEKIIFTDLDWKKHSKIKEVTVPFLKQADYNEVKQAAWTRRPADDVDIAGKKVIEDAIYFATRQRKLSSTCGHKLNCRQKKCRKNCPLKP